MTFRVSFSFLAPMTVDSILRTNLDYHSPGIFYTIFFGGVNMSLPPLLKILGSWSIYLSVCLSVLSNLIDVFLHVLFLVLLPLFWCFSSMTATTVLTIIKLHHHGLCLTSWVKPYCEVYSIFSINLDTFYQW